MTESLTEPGVPRIYRDTLRVLKEARRLVAQGWCQDHGATSRRGLAVHFCDPAAECFSAFAAILRAADALHLVIAPVRLSARTIWPDDGGSAIDRVQTWNNAPERRQGEVLAAFDRAIALVEGADNPILTPTR